MALIILPFCRWPKFFDSGRQRLALIHTGWVELTKDRRSITLLFEFCRRTICHRMKPLHNRSRYRDATMGRFIPSDGYERSDQGQQISAQVCHRRSNDAGGRPRQLLPYTELKTSNLEPDGFDWRGFWATSSPPVDFRKRLSEKRNFSFFQALMIQFTGHFSR